ncbi:MAG: ATP-binding protein [Cystobacter sp.]
MWNDHALFGLMSLLLGTAWVDVLYLGRFSLGAFGIRVAWAMSLGVLKALSERSPAWNRATMYLFVLACSSFLLGLVALTGGVGTPYFILVASLPVGLGVVQPLRKDRGAILLGGVMCVVGTALLLAHARRPLVEASFWLLLMLSTTLIADFLAGRVCHALVAEQEIRQERARREALEALTRGDHRRAQTEKLALVGQLSAGVAHEINNPLAYVSSNVDYVHEELLSVGPLDREALAEVLAETRVGLLHIQRVVADLKGFSRMEDSHCAECSLAEVVSDAVKLASLRLKHVAWLNIDIPADLPRLFAVRQRLVQVVLNLLVNASDVLETHRTVGGEVRIAARLEGSRVVLLIEDNGPGFPPHVLPRLFEPFFTTKGPDKGTGLGLNLSRELVAQFGGRLTASNRPEGGARLCLELPVGGDRSLPDTSLSAALRAPRSPVASRQDDPP